MVTANLGGKPTTFGTKMEYWSVTRLPLGKPRAIYNIFSSLSPEVGFGGLSVFVTEWRWTNRE